MKSGGDTYMAAVASANDHVRVISYCSLRAVLIYCNMVSCFGVSAFRLPWYGFLRPLHGCEKRANAGPSKQHVTRDVSCRCCNYSATVRQFPTLISPPGLCGTVFMPTAAQCGTDCVCCHTTGASPRRARHPRLACDEASRPIARFPVSFYGSALRFDLRLLCSAEAYCSSDAHASYPSREASVTIRDSNVFAMPTRPF